MNKVGVLLETTVTQNLKGTELTEEMVPETFNLEEIPNELKESSFWITFQIMGKRNL
jgi:hypothetical protein